MAVFPGYTLESMWRLPFSSLIPLSEMAEMQRREQTAVFAQSTLYANSKTGLADLNSLREPMQYMDPKKARSLRSEENINRAMQIAEDIASGNRR